MRAKTRSSWGRGLSRLGFYGVMGVGLWLMFSASTSYLDLGQAHPFFLEKLPLAHPEIWLVALYVHVPSALFSLPACLLLLSRRVRRRLPRLHRGLGRVTGVLVLGAVVPSGLYLAFFAQGGVWATLGFWATGLITFVAMSKSIASARTRDFRAHRRYSAHVVAQLSVAVMSRFLLVFAEELGWYSESVYVAALLIPVAAGALVVEWLTAWSSNTQGVVHEKLGLGSRFDVVR